MQSLCCQKSVSLLLSVGQSILACAVALVFAIKRNKGEAEVPAESSESSAMAENGKQVMVIGVDESEHSFYALQWTLDHFFASHSQSLFKLVIVHARTLPSSVLGVAGPGSVDILPIIDADLKKIATRTINSAKEICSNSLVEDVQFKIMEGDPRNVMLEAVEKFHPSVLVLGSHGYGAVKRAVLGSVSDYCAHHAHCSVMIVKRPKSKPSPLSIY